MPLEKFRGNEIMKFTENSINVMTTRTYKGIGKSWITKNLSASKSESEIVELLNSSTKFSNPLTLEEFNGKKNLIKGCLLSQKA
jgi:DNA processing protein